MNSAPVMWFADLDAESEQHGNYAKQMARLTQSKFPIVPGFVITPLAYQDFLHVNNLKGKINQLLSTVSFERPDSLMQGEYHIKELFQKSLLSDYFINELMDFYNQLGEEVTLEIFETGKHGKKHGKTRIDTKEELKKQIISLWAEMFSGNALWSRHQRNHDHFDNSAEIIVQKKILGDKTGSIFTLDPFTHAHDKLVILTQKPHDGDQYVLSKKNLTIIDRMLKQSHDHKLTLNEIHAIAQLGKRIEEHLFFPQEVSWILEGDKLYIKTIKPFTESAIQKPKAKTKLPIARGKGLNKVVGTGLITIINNPNTIGDLNPHAVIVIRDIYPSQLKKLKKISGIIIESHPLMEATILIKHKGIPTICNVKDATKQFRNGSIVTLHAELGEIYSGGFHN